MLSQPVQVTCGLVSDIERVTVVPSTIGEEVQPAPPEEVQLMPPTSEVITPSPFTLSEITWVIIGVKVTFTVASPVIVTGAFVVAMSVHAARGV